MKKVLLSLAIIFLLAYVFYIVYPRDINFIAKGVKYRLGNEYDGIEQTLNIQIKGKLYSSFSGDKTFKGIIEIEGEVTPVPENQRELELHFYKGLSALIIYPYNNYGKGEHFIYGYLYINRKFNKVTIAIQEGHEWNGKNGLMFTAPATNKSDALQISNELMN